MYHLLDGKILQGGRGEGSEWSGQGHRAQVRKGISTAITCQINLRNRMVTWLQDGRFLGQGRFSQYLSTHEFVPYIMLCHKGDTIDLNG